MTERAAKIWKRVLHFDQNGNAVMVDVSGKQVTYRTALATGYISVGPEIMEAVTAGNVKKGDVLGVARVAGIMGVKKNFRADSDVPSASDTEMFC